MPVPVPMSTAFWIFFGSGAVYSFPEDEGVQVMENVHRFGMTHVIGLPCFSIANVAVIRSSENVAILKDAL